MEVLSIIIVYILVLLLNRQIYFKICRIEEDIYLNPIDVACCFFFILGTLILLILLFIEIGLNKNSGTGFFTPKHLRKNKK